MRFSGYIRPVVLVLLAGCGHLKPAQFQEQVHTVQKRVPTTAAQWTQRGWWSYLNDEVTSAKRAWIQAKDQPLARLGLGLLALDNHQEGLAIRYLQSIPDGGLIGRIATRKRYELTESAPDRVPALRWSSAITPWVYLGMNALVQDPPYMEAEKPNVINAFGQDHPLGVRPMKAGIMLATLDSQPNGHFEVETYGPTAIWNEDRQAWQQSAGRDAALWVPVHASKHLIIAWASRSTPRIRVFSDRGTQSPLKKYGPAVRGRALGTNWVQHFLLALNAVDQGDGNAALQLLRNAPQTAPFDQLRARAYTYVQDMPKSVKRDRQIQRWRQVRTLAPYAAHLALARLYQETGQIERAHRALLVLKRRFRSDRAIHTQWIRILDRLGRTRELRAYLKRFARPCEHLELRQRLLRYQDPTPLAQRLEKCGLGRQAADLLLQYHRPQAAIDLLNSSKAHWPEKPNQQLRALMGLWPKPLRPGMAEKLEGRSAKLTALDLTLSTRETTDFGAKVGAFITADVTSPISLHLMATNASWSPLKSLYLPTEHAIKRHLSQSKTPRTARVLDHSILLYDQSGRSVRRVHEILSIGSRSAAEQFGELGLPEDAIPISIYTRKADGSILHADMALEKESFSLPDLSPGDFVVAVYLEPNSDAGTTAGGFLSQRTYFGDFDIEIGHQRLDVIPPNNHKMKAERQFNAPKPRAISSNGQPGVRFEAHNIKPIKSEPRSPVPEAIIPSVRVGSDISFEDDLMSFRERFLMMTHISPQFRYWVQSIVQAAQTGQTPDVVTALLSAVRHRYDGTVGLVSERVGRGLFDGVGHRTQALSAALTVAGVAHSVHLAGASASGDESKFGQVSDYQTALIELVDGRWIYPGPDRGPVGYLPFSLLGGRSVIIWPPSAPTTPRYLPTRRAIKDSRTVQMTAHLDAEGLLSGHVIDRLQGAEAIAVGRMMGQLAKSERPRLVERILIKAITSGQIHSLDPTDGTDGTDALTLKYQFSGRLPSPNRLGCFPIQPGQTFAMLELRQSPLILSLPVDQTVEIQMTSDTEFTVDESFKDIASGPHRFSRRIVKDGNKMTMTCRLQIAGGHILPKDYPVFRDWARQVDRAEQVSITHKIQ